MKCHCGPCPFLSVFLLSLWKDPVYPAESPCIGFRGVLGLRVETSMRNPYVPPCGSLDVGPSRPVHGPKKRVQTTCLGKKGSVNSTGSKSTNPPLLSGMHAAYR